MAKFGFIGCGNMGGALAVAISKKISADNIVLFDVCAEKANAQYGNENTKVYTDYKELLKDQTIDAVLVLTHNSEHCRITVDAFEAAQKLQAIPRNANPIRLHNRCKITGRPKGYIRMFGISRIQFREMASAGLIPGVKKASW